MKRTDIHEGVGYAIKRAQSALRSALDRGLREVGLTVPQYSCLEQLSHRPGLSNADLARGAFVSRQAMHQLLGGLVADGLVVGTGTGRDVRYRCTGLGERKVTVASRLAAAVEDRMLAGFDGQERARLLDDLTQCVEALRAPESFE